jgi:hypothetical protein
MIQILGFEPKATELETFDSTFKKDFGEHVKAINLEPHDKPRFKQPVEVKFEAASEENVVYIQK